MLQDDIGPEGAIHFLHLALPLFKAGAQFLPQDGVYLRHRLADGRVVDVVPLLFGQARLCVGQPDSSAYDDLW